MGVKVKFDKRLNNFGSAAKKMKDLSQVWKAISDLELSQTKLRFIKQQDPSGKAWPEPRTLRRGTGPETGSGARTKVSDWSRSEAWAYTKKARFWATAPGYRFFNPSSDKILRDTGVLFNSIQRAYTSTYAVVGTNTQYGKKLQEGRFPFLGINKKTIENVNFVFKKFLGGLLK